MTTTTIDGLSRPSPAKANRRDTPIWVLPEPARGSATPAGNDDVLPGDALPVVRHAAHPARMLRVVAAAVESGEATRGRPPPFSAAFVVAAQWAFFGAAALNLVLW